MVVNLHFQFAAKEPKTLTLNLEGKRVKQGDTVWLSDQDRRKIRETYRKVFHRPIDGVVFTFHTGKSRPKGKLDGPIERVVYDRGNFGHTFNYESRERYRLIIPRGPRKHLWTNGRRARIFRHRRIDGGFRWRRQ